MKRLIYPFLGLSALMVSGVAAAGETAVLGYVNTNARNEGTFRGLAADAVTSGAIFVPAGTLKSMSGAVVSEIDALLASSINIASIDVWIRYELDGENLVSQRADKASRGWNNVTLEQPWTIPADIDRGVYIGYSLAQQGVANAIGNNTEPSEKGLFTNVDGRGWQDNSCFGTLSLLAKVEGESLPACNIGVTGVTADRIAVCAAESLSAKVRVKNNGTSEVNGIDYTLSLDGREWHTGHDDLKLAAGKSASINITAPNPVSEEGNHEITFGVASEGCDADSSDNNVTIKMTVLQQPLKKTALIEEFTTEICVNCPTGASTIHDYVEKNCYDMDVAIVCHHSGFGSDWLTSDADREYLWYFNDEGSAFAPAIMVDRLVSPLSDSPTANTTVTDLNRLFGLSRSRETLVDMQCEAAYRESDDLLSVSVIGTRYGDRRIDNPVVTVYLLENNVPARYQMGAGPEYIHNHVKRAISSVWGEPVEFNADGTFSFTTSFEMNPEWKRSDFEVVAFLHSSDSSDRRVWSVENAVRVPASLFTSSGTAEIEVPNTETALYFTIDGKSADREHLQPGIYIRRCGNHTDKILVR